ncbi:hypothetical protein DKX38_027299 [Salix brachista]|uniref:Uncharacterized protein n=1 Tax=Salix brachista TaxID=2182728 RepID=A0A5N5JBU5_9ROSI|nr:hypothetical protein DKX38_027299 [Salix brachista]
MRFSDHASSTWQKWDWLAKRRWIPLICLRTTLLLRSLEDIIKNNGHFCIERMNTLDHPMMKMKVDVRIAISHFRAVFQGLLEEHFGKDDADRIFQHFPKFAENNDSVINGATHQHVDHFILLKRNIN